MPVTEITESRPVEVRGPFAARPFPGVEDAGTR